MSDAPSRQICVLIVDDHELVRVGLPTLLSTDPEIEVLGECHRTPKAATGGHVKGGQLRGRLEVSRGG